jgi:hypothetical protein
MRSVSGCTAGARHGRQQHHRTVQPFAKYNIIQIISNSDEMGNIKSTAQRIHTQSETTGLIELQ